MIFEERVVRSNGLPAANGPAIYWMSRDQRIRDNCSLVRAQDWAISCDQKVHVAFCLTDEVPGSTMAHLSFMMEGLAKLAEELAGKGIPFHLLEGSPGQQVAEFARKMEAGFVVADYSPLRMSRKWWKTAAEELTIRLDAVDAHNIVPVHIASQKLEYAARTIRPKLQRLLADFMAPAGLVANQEPDAALIEYGIKTVKAAFRRRSAGRNPYHPASGEIAAMRRLHKFMDEGLDRYPLSRDPNEAAQSGISPYLHFGQISARSAVEAAMLKGGQGSEDFIEQAFIRRELAENFCANCERYDTTESFPDWARKTLASHSKDERDYDYGMDELEACKTHDMLWNASQRSVMIRGSMPGYLRMYWAKKLLEWSISPEEAMRKAIALNDKWSLDGRDPNGYTGIAWSIGGVHDRPWGERPIFGTIRYMSYEGARRKFDVERFIRENM